MTQILRCLIFAMIGVPCAWSTSQAQEPGKLTADVRVHSQAIYWEDPLYVAIKLTNQTDQAVMLPRTVSLLSSACTINISIPDTSYSRSVRLRHAIGMVVGREQELASGKSLEDIKVIEFPDEETKHSLFWHHLAQASSFVVEVRFPGDFVSNDETKIEIQLRQRPQDEQALLNKLKAKSTSSHQASIHQFSGEDLDWHPYSTLHYLSQPVSEDELLVDEFVNVRDQLSAGSLKNGLLITHQLQEITDRHGRLSETHRQQSTGSLLNWLEGLNPIEAKYLASYYQGSYTSRMSGMARFRKGDKVLSELDQKLLRISSQELPPMRD